MEVKSRHVLNIEFELRYMELILLKYLKYEPNTTYVSGIRFPPEDRSKFNAYKDLNMLSTHPYEPIFSAVLVKYIVEFVASNMNTYRSLLNANSLLPNPNEAKSIYPNTDSVEVELEDIVLDFIPGITHDDYKNVMNIVKPIITKIEQVISLKPEAIYSVDIETKEFVILECDDIVKFRFYEAMDAKKEE